MKENETYIKLYDFVYEALKLDNIDAIFLSLLITYYMCDRTYIYRIGYFAGLCHCSERSMKNTLECLSGIGLIIKSKGKQIKVSLNISEVEKENLHSSADIKTILVQKLHECNNYTSEKIAQMKCKNCPFSSENFARNIKKNKKNCNKNKLARNMDSLFPASYVDLK